MAIRVLFIDRDGTLIEEPADKQVDELGKVRLVDNVIPALLELQQSGYRLVMVSNQDGLGTASFPEPAFQVCQDHVLALFGSLQLQAEAAMLGNLLKHVIVKTNARRNRKGHVGVEIDRGANVRLFSRPFDCCLPISMTE